MRQHVKCVYCFGRAGHIKMFCVRNAYVKKFCTEQFGTLHPGDTLRDLALATG
jgi:hypothetical protein